MSSDPAPGRDPGLFFSPRTTPYLPWNPWLFVVLAFLAGLTARCVAFERLALAPDHQEGDERVYMALVDQLEHGRGYTLRGNPVLLDHIFDREYYDRPLFFHPPGGVALFWVFHRLLGRNGFAAAELFCYAVFFWSMILLLHAVLDPPGPMTLAALALLAAFTPIMAHAVGRIWIDGPLLAFATAAAATFVAGAVQRNTWLLLSSAVLLGYAGLIKMTAVLIVPGMVALALASAPAGSLGYVAGAAAIVGVIAALLHAPWEFWQLRVLGTMFPAGVGKTSPEMLRVNPFLYDLTVLRPAWAYLVLLPQILWTLVPALLLWAWQWPNRQVRRKGLALILWIATVVGFQMALSAAGYTKAVRHVILVTPATLLLFALAANAAVEILRVKRPLRGGRAVTAALLLLAAGGAALEVAQGIKTPIVEKQLDVINPLTGKKGIVNLW